MNVTKILLIVINLACLFLLSCKRNDKISTPVFTVSPVVVNMITPSPAILPSATITWYNIKTPTSIPTVSFFSPPFSVSTIIAEKTADTVKITPIPKVTSSQVEFYKFVTRWGKKGKGNGEFLCPISIAVDTENYIYVVDRDITCIQKFDSSGKFITRWGSKGKEKGQFDNPRGIAVSSLGHVFIADSRNNRIQIFDSTGNFIKKWTSYNPREIALDLNENVYLPEETGNNIWKLDSNGKSLKDYWTNRVLTDCYYFGQIVIDRQGYIYVVYATHPSPGTVYTGSYYQDLCIKKFDFNCNLVRVWGLTGDKDVNVQITEETIKELGRIQITEETIKELYGKVDTSKFQFLMKNDFKQDELKENLDKMGYTKEQIKLVLNHAKEFYGKIDTCNLQNLMNKDFKQDELKKELAKIGYTKEQIEIILKHTDKDGQFRSMMGLAIDSKGYIYTADPVAGKIQKFDSSGNFITKWNSDKAGNEKFKPTGIAVDSEGNVYVTDPGNYCIQKFRQKN